MDDDLEHSCHVPGNHPMAGSPLVQGVVGVGVDFKTLALPGS